MNFSANDLALLESNGSTTAEIQKQIDLFKRGFPFVNLVAAAGIGNGILKLSVQELIDFSNDYDEAELNVVKFVPASGAATRMFKHLFEALDDQPNELASELLLNKHRLPFSHLLGATNDRDILNEIIGTDGLNYANAPKGLVPFHNYAGTVRTAFEEHLHEGLGYALKRGKTKIHFTINQVAHDKIADHLSKTSRIIESSGGVQCDVSYSYQKSATDTIAVDLNNVPIRNMQGDLVYRPAGHGALLENLNEIDADLIFIKNIDNITVDAKRGDTIAYKKALAGLMLSFQKEVFAIVRELTKGNSLTQDQKRFLQERMNLDLSVEVKELINYLNRPIRVCGMVENTGEPGGGPFWVAESNGVTSLQIIERAQIDPTNEQQLEIFTSSSHFNPVDLVCGVRDFNGDKFDLLKYRDNNSGFISEKSFQGKKIKSMELPGLWNGAMGKWISIFVEVPLTVFSPVKTVNDLLRPEHQV